MVRTVTEHEMGRRLAVAIAVGKLTEVMASCGEMTPLEWLRVLADMQDRILKHGLNEEWNEDA